MHGGRARIRQLHRAVAQRTVFPDAMFTLLCISVTLVGCLIGPVRDWRDISVLLHFFLLFAGGTPRFVDTAAVISVIGAVVVGLSPLIKLPDPLTPTRVVLSSIGFVDIIAAFYLLHYKDSDGYHLIWPALTAIVGAIAPSRL